jgi:lipopolysaccharide/colanic/teichoic acid biosynthesis glycosyltransferase/glycosyltransferase involved in cell wall biosynthesis/nucleoside-diphosphate-sugar epimerase
MGKKKISKYKKIAGVAAALSGVYFLMRAVAKSRTEAVSVDEDNPYIDREDFFAKAPAVYERIGKPMMDRGLAFVGLILLAPLFAVISLAIFLDDPGPIFFTQKRVGKDGHFFYLHKFRSMKMSTPHDVPTHQLSDPDQYITRMGRLLRKTSLDELPQIWDIFRGRMSVIGPRPALWNQEDLIAEREKYGANAVFPGLTGWAQINGRDELEISEKAKLDGAYVKHLQQGGWKALFFDVKCFFGTIKSVLGSDGVVEGGTGELHRNDIDKVSREDVGFESYGYKKSLHIDWSACRRILITGANSYIGESFEAYAKKYYGSHFVIDTVDMIDGSWREKDFSLYDVVFHVAGLAHADVGNVDEETKRKYYAVNTDLAIETARKARDEGVKQFIFMSSMIIYGESAPFGKEKIIDEHTVPAPANFYGDSKWQADKGVRRLGSESFHVAVLRPPMIYGPGSKGNYPILSKLAKKLPIFPDIDNQRSMLYIDNLCEFLCLLMLSGEGGIYFPQNRDYTKTVEMVKEINKATKKKIWITKLLNPLVIVGTYFPGKISVIINKAFGNMIYDQKLSFYPNLNYRVKDLHSSIITTEKGRQNKCVLFLVNHDVVIYNFRLELVERLIKEGFEVHISCPYGERIDDLVNLGVIYHNINIERHGMNFLKEWNLLHQYAQLVEEVQPLIILTYTIKPNIYGGIVARKNRIPFIANITGLGVSVENGGIKQKAILCLYKIGLFGAETVYFQNTENERFMLKHRIINGNYELLPGSGVNLIQHKFEKYPEVKDPLIFTTIGRIMKDKGIDELLDAANIVKKKYPNVQFRLIGFFDDNYQSKVEKAVKKGIVEYIEQQKDIHPFIKESHAIIHPSHHEGMSNVLLESAATGRPVIASKIPGCREAFDEGVSGFGFEAQNANDLVRAIQKFINLPYVNKMEMGKNGRLKMESSFDRNIVVEKYLDRITEIMEAQDNV